MKKAFLLWTLLTPLAIASEVKIEEDFSSKTPLIKRTAGVNIEDWKFQEHYNRTYNGSFGRRFSHLNSPSASYGPLDGSAISKSLEITPLFKNNFIKNISLKNYINGDHEIHIHTKEMKDCPSDFNKKFNNSSCLGHKFFSTTKNEKFPEFLNFFYQNQYLLDCIVDFILKKMADQKVFIEDFRLTPVKIISELDQALTERSSEEDFQILLTEKLEKVKDPARCQNLIAEVVINLQKENASSPLIKKLTQEVTDPTATPLYAEIKLIQSDIEMNDFVTQPDSQARYRKALQTLLDVPSVSTKPEIQKQIEAQTNILIKNIYNNDQPSYDPLPLALQGLKLDSHSMIDMLMHISQLTQENKKLQQQITKELAVDRSN